MTKSDRAGEVLTVEDGNGSEDSEEETTCPKIKLPMIRSLLNDLITFSDN